MFSKSKRAAEPGKEEARPELAVRGGGITSSVAVVGVDVAKVSGAGQKAESAADPSLLSSYVFDDIYIPECAGALVKVRRLRMISDTFKGTTKTGLHPVPDQLKGEVELLHQAVHAGWREHQYRREFVITFRDLAYRCALIAPPGLEGPDAIEGREWCVRMIAPKIPSLSDLRLPPSAIDDLHSLISKRGIVLVGGPFASGKTTLASVAFDLWVRHSNDVGISFEDPPEIPMERNDPETGKIIQIDTTGLSIEEAIKLSRRWSYRYMFLGEIRSSDVASEMLHIGISGPLVICTIHANDPVEAIRSFYRFVSATMSEEGAREMIADSLLHVFHQRIVGQRAILRSLSMTDEGGSLARTLIKNGDFNRLKDEFQRQETNRSRE